MKKLILTAFVTSSLLAIAASASPHVHCDDNQGNDWSVDIASNFQTAKLWDNDHVTTLVHSNTQTFDTYPAQTEHTFKSKQYEFSYIVEARTGELKGNPNSKNEFTVPFTCSLRN